MPSAEYLTAYASIATFLVIAATAIAAFIQLRHIHGANQLAGLLHMTEMWRGEVFQAANTFIREELPARMQDPAFRAQLVRPDPDRRYHPELFIADTLEQTGSYIKYGMIDGEQFLDLTNSYIIHTWDNLREVVLLRRAASGGNSMYENFEYLTVRALDFGSKFSEGNYPRGMRRLISDNEWQALRRELKMP